MAKFYFTNKAVEDLAVIWDYTFENWSERQADKYYELLIMTCATLANDPRLGDLGGFYLTTFIPFPAF